VMNAGVDRPLNRPHSRSMNPAQCCRNLRSSAPNWPLTARAIVFLIPISILRSSCSGDNGPFVAADETFVIVLLVRLQPAIEFGKMAPQDSADCNARLTIHRNSPVRKG
jgi:hypothetical protein